MRSILYLLLLACVFASCKNTKSLEPDQSAGLNNIYAKWQLKSYSGGFVGYRNKPAEDGQFIEFKSDGTFNTYKNNALTGTTTFTIKKGKSIFTTDSLYQLSLSNSSLIEAILAIKPDTLQLADEAYDGFACEYIRVK